MSKKIKQIIIHLNKLLIITFILLILSSTILVYAYSKKIYVLEENTSRYCMLKVDMYPIFYVKPSILYNYKHTIQTNTAFYSITKKILVNLQIQYIIHNDTELGKTVETMDTISFYSTIKTSNWKIDRYPVNISINNKHNYTIRIWLSNISKIVNMVNTEINTRSRIIEYTIHLNIELLTKYNGSIQQRYSLNPVVIIRIDKDKNKVSVQIINSSKTYGHKTINKKLVIADLLGIKIVELRKYSILSTVSLTFLSIFLILVYMSRINKNRENELKQYFSKQIEGRIIDYGGKTLVEIDLKTFRNLINHYKILPIYDHSRNTLFIVLRDIIYHTRLDLGRDKND